MGARVATELPLGDGVDSAALASTQRLAPRTPTLSVVVAELQASRRVLAPLGRHRALVATNPMLVWYSQEARAYSLLVFLTALAFLFFVTALQRPTRGTFVGWAV